LCAPRRRKTSTTQTERSGGEEATAGRGDRGARRRGARRRRRRKCDVRVVRCCKSSRVRTTYCIGIYRVHALSYRGPLAGHTRARTRSHRPAIYSATKIKTTFPCVNIRCVPSPGDFITPLHYTRTHLYPNPVGRGSTLARCVVPVLHDRRVNIILFCTRITRTRTHRFIYSV